jgi:CheY-like chemotaxis protein
LTACADDADREACLKAGMDAFLAKSIEPVPLAAAIRVFLHEASGAAVP